MRHLEGELKSELESSATPMLHQTGDLDNIGKWGRICISGCTRNMQNTWWTCWKNLKKHWGLGKVLSYEIWPTGQSTVKNRCQRKPGQNIPNINTDVLSHKKRRGSLRHSDKQTMQLVECRSGSRSKPPKPAMSWEAQASRNACWGLATCRRVSSSSKYDIHPVMIRSYPSWWFGLAIQQFNAQPNTLRWSPDSHRLQGIFQIASPGNRLLHQTYCGKILLGIYVKVP